MTDLIKQILSRVRWSKWPVRADHPDDLVGLAVTHFAEDFPNSGRDDCPTPGTFSVLISSGLLPSDDLREHMLMCSECFGYYRQELTRHRTDKSVRVEGRILNTRGKRLVPMLAGGLACALAVLAIVIINNRYEGISERTHINSMPSPVSAPTAAGDGWEPKLATPETAAPQTPANRQSSVPNRHRPSNSAIAQNRISINLENYNPLRGAVLAQPPSILLRTTQNELLIKLPAGSPQGSYVVNLSNPYGRALRSAEAISRDGKQLRLNLALSSVKPGDYLICLIHETEVPQCIPAVVLPVVNKK